MTARYKWNKAWRQRHPQGRNRDRRRYYASHRNPPANRLRARTWWTAEEVVRILALDRPSDPILAQQLGRSVQAIQGKRNRLRDKKQSEKAQPVSPPVLSPEDQ